MTELAALNVVIDGRTDGFRAALNQSKRDLEKFSNSARQSANFFEKALKSEERALESLRRAMDPVYASTKRYEAAIQQLDTALKRGNLTEAEHVRLMAQAKATFLATGTSATQMASAYGGFASRLSASRGTIQLVSYQVQDIAVQLAGGAKASTVFAQQGSQIASAFGPVGAVIGALAAVALPALAFAFSRSSENADSFRTALDGIREIQSGLTETTDILSMSVDELRQKYGDAAAMVRRFALAQAEAQAAQAKSRLQDQLALVGPEIDGIAAAVKRVADAEDYLALVRQRVDQGIAGSGMIADAQDALAVYSDSLQEIADKFGISAAAAQPLFAALTDLSTAGNFDEQQAALMRVDEAMQTLGVSAEQIPPQLNNALIELRKLVDKANELAQAARNARDAAAGVNTSSPYPSLLGPTGAPVMPPGKPATAPGSRGGGGGGQANPIQTALDSLQQSLLTAEELQMQSYQRQQQTLQDALQQRLITQQEYASLMEQVEQTHQYAMGQEARQGVSTVLGALGQMFEGSKQVGAGIALVNAWLAFSEALKDPRLTPWGRFAAAAKALAAGMSAVRGIKSASKGGGGSGGGGATAGTVSAPAHSQQVAISLSGSDMFSRSSVIQLINEINKAVDDGARIRIV